MLHFLKNLFKKAKNKNYLEKALEIREKKEYGIFSIDSFSYLQKDLPEDCYLLAQYVNLTSRGKGNLDDVFLKISKSKRKITIIYVPRKLEKLFRTKKIKIENLNKTFNTQFKIVWIK